MIYDGTKKKILNAGHFFFNLGFIFLPSAFPIGGFFLLLALVISILNSKNAIFFDRWNYCLFLVSFFIILSCLKNTLHLPINDSSLWKSSYLWIDLFNWIPLFLCFYGFQSFLKSSKDRILFIKSLIIGSFPILISCIGQWWFDWQGPFSILNGSIIWYLKPITTQEKAISGLFSNPNYTAFWLTTILPLSISLIYINKNFKKKLSILTTVLILYLGILTNSRNAIFGIFAGLSFMLGTKFLIIFFVFLITTFIFNEYFLLSLPNILIKEVRKFIPQKLFSKLLHFNINDFLNYTRVEIWMKTGYLISLKPIFGWGASTFSIIYLLNGGKGEAQHAHNIILQLFYNYGSLSALTLIFFIFILILKSWHKIKTKSNNIENKGFLVSSILALSFHMSDIPYFDGRISILIWTLLAGLKCVIQEDEKIKN